MSELHTPIYTAKIASRRSAHTPSKIDLEGAVVRTLQKEAVFSKPSGKHRLVVHNNPPLPHHPDGSIVLWVDQVTAAATNERALQPWKQEVSWQKLLQDVTFCQATEAQLRRWQRANQKLRVYHFVGFPNCDQRNAVLHGPNGVQSVVYAGGAQSQSRAHIHLVETIPTTHVAISTPTLAELLQKPTAVPSLLGLAARQSLEDFSHDFVGFGSRLNTVQNLGVGSKTVPVERTFFEFSTWREALQNIFTLQQELADCWLDHAYAVCAKPTQWLQQVISLRQTLACIPVFAVIRPSLEDQRQLGRHCDWLVVPFSLEIPSTFFGNGVLLDRG